MELFVACITCEKIKPSQPVSNLGRQKPHHSVPLSISARKLHSQDAVLGCQISRDGIGRQFPCCQHDITEVESSVVHCAQLHVVASSGGWAEVLERRLHPVKAGEVAASQNIHIGMAAGFGLR